MKREHNPANKGYRRSVYRWDEMSDSAKKHFKKLTKIYLNEHGEVFKWPKGYFWYKEARGAEVQRITAPFGRVRDVNVQPVRPAIKKERKHSCLKAIAIILTIWALAWIVGWTAAKLERVEYVIPIDDMKNIKISPITWTQEEWDYALRHGEVIGANIVRPKAKVYAKEEPKTVEDIVAKYFGRETKRALACFKSESGLRATAVNYSNRNGTWDSGIAQINSVHCSKLGTTDKAKCRDMLFDVETNIKMAYEIWSHSGWNAWYGSACN